MSGNTSNNKSGEKSVVERHRDEESFIRRQLALLDPHGMVPRENAEMMLRAALRDHATAGDVAHTAAQKELVEKKAKEARDKAARDDADRGSGRGDNQGRDGRGGQGGGAGASGGAGAGAGAGQGQAV